MLIEWGYLQNNIYPIINNAKNIITQNKDEKGINSTNNIPNAIHNNANPKTRRIIHPCFYYLIKYMQK